MGIHYSSHQSMANMTICRCVRHLVTRHLNYHRQQWPRIVNTYHSTATEWLRLPETLAMRYDFES